MLTSISQIFSTFAAEINSLLIKIIMKKNLIILTLGLFAIMPARAQWSQYNTDLTIGGVFDVLNKSIQSAERKKQMEIHAKEKLEYEQSFKDAMDEAKNFEADEKWDDALSKYEEAAKLNCNYGYSDQKQITRKINSLYVKAGTAEDGPSILNNATTMLPSYSQYRYVRENPVYVNKKQTSVKIVRVACSETETRLELECEATHANHGVSVSGKAYIKGNKGGKMTLESIDNVTMQPAVTHIPWPYQKLRFVLIFPAMPEDADDFDFIVPSSSWQFKNIKCK